MLISRHKIIKFLAYNTTYTQACFSLLFVATIFYFYS